MPVLDSFDPLAYTRIPNLDVPSLIALTRQVLAALPSRPSPAVKASASELEAVVVGAEQSFGDHLRTPSVKDGRPIDQAGDVSWGCFQRFLSAMAELPHDLYPKAVQAAGLLEALFPTGLGFLTLEYGAQWAEAEQRVRRIQKDKLKPTILALGGADFLTEIERCHAAYSEMVGVTKVKSPKSKLPDLREQRLKLQGALAAHAIQLVAMVLSGGESALKSAQPSFDAIDAYREKATPSAADKKSPPEPAAPPPA